MCDKGESQQQLLERFEGSLVGPSIRPVPYTAPDGSEGTDLFLDPEAFGEAFAADVDPPRPRSWPRANATIVEVPASHVSFLSQPEAATQLILLAVEATATAAGP
jgi:hypothetical protein